MNNHQVINQSPIFQNHNLFEIDQPLRHLLQSSDTQWGIDRVIDYGALMGTDTWIEKGFAANNYSPKFKSHDTKGVRIDAVEFHPAYHELMQLAIQHQIHTLPWALPQKGAHRIRMALYYLHAQNEAGTACPLTMTFSCVPALQRNLPQAEEWLPKITEGSYDPRNVPSFEKKGLTIGMAMTEKQGGTDVRANTTFAEPLAQRGRGELYKITGHKWFCSAPMCDAFLTLAQTEAGLSCFLFPRWKPDGSKNHFRIQRLKDKLGNRSNASSEIEFDGAHAWLLGEEGRGVPTIIEMVALTRYDCMIGSAALMRRGLTEVLHHIQHRKVMGKLLIEQPLMQNVVADLCLESTAALTLTYRTALCLENQTDEKEQLLLRLLTPIGKYWLTKRATAFLGEAMECLGGNGYVEDSILPRLYREAPVNAIWEGSGNVQCLDVLRAIQKSPKTLEVLITELELAQSKNPYFDSFLADLKGQLQGVEVFSARRLTEMLALALQAAQLLLHGDTTIAKAFCQTRLRSNTMLMWGGLEDNTLAKAILKVSFTPLS